MTVIVQTSGLHLLTNFLLALLPGLHKKSTGTSLCGAMEMKSVWYLWGCGFNLCPCSVAQGSSIVMSCSVGQRSGWDPTFLWLSCKPATVAQILPIAWEPPYAEDMALFRKIKKKSTGVSFIHSSLDYIP